MSLTKSKIYEDTYRDSVFLMKISNEIDSLEGIEIATAMMGTDRNKDLMDKNNLVTEKVANANANDLVFSLRAESEDIVQEAMEKLDELLSSSLEKKENKSANKEVVFETIEDAVAYDDDYNLALISVAGDYAKYEAVKALKNGLNVMLYSDNVPLEDELKLKKYAHNNGLLVMGADCGTSIINGVPLGFANKIKDGNISIVGASGTGIQEIVSAIDNYDGGLNQAVGTGGNDIKDEIGAITMLDSLEYFDQDEKTEVIVVVTKPPAESVQKKLGEFIKKSNKKVVISFLGTDDYSAVESDNSVPAYTLEEAARKAVVLSENRDLEEPKLDENLYNDALAELNELEDSQEYLRGIFGGGSLCYEALYYSSKNLKDADKVYSNLKLDNSFVLENVEESKNNTFLDVGEDEFTVGKPHPMIDPTAKMQRVIKEVNSGQTAIILTDVVIGSGSYEDPAGALVEAKKKFENDVVVVATVCGTKEDSQGLTAQKEKLENNGIYVLDSNIQAVKFAVKLYNSQKN